MKFTRACCVILLLTTAASCSASDAEESRSSATSDSSADSPTEDVPVTNETATSEGPVSGDGNASITLGDQEYRFTTSTCSFDDINGDDVSGVVTIDGVPTFVEFAVLDDSTGLISLAVGVSEDSPASETLEESLENGLQKVWNLFYEAADVIDVSETAISGTGEFLLVLTIADGSSGDTLPGAFEADCS